MKKTSGAPRSSASAPTSCTPRAARTPTMSWTISAALRTTCSRSPAWTTSSVVRQDRSPHRGPWAGVLDDTYKYAGFREVSSDGKAVVLENDLPRTQEFLAYITVRVGYRD